MRPILFCPCQQLLSPSIVFRLLRRPELCSTDEFPTALLTAMLPGVKADFDAAMRSIEDAADREPA